MILYLMEKIVQTLSARAREREKPWNMKIKYVLIVLFLKYVNKMLGDT
jgi:hypothetical protein